jgi:hypothetical protein
MHLPALGADVGVGRQLADEAVVEVEGLHVLSTLGRSRGCA